METVIRVIVIYILIVAGLRVMGKKEFSQLSALELVGLLLVPQIVSQALLQEDFSLINAVVALATLFSLVFASSLLSFHSRNFSKMITGSPTVVAAHGKLLKEAMSKERIDEEQIFEQMHKSGLEKLEEVKWAILESDGRISIIPKKPQAVAQIMSKEEDVR